MKKILGILIIIGSLVLVVPSLAQTNTNPVDFLASQIASTLKLLSQQIQVLETQVQSLEAQIEVEGTEAQTTIEPTQVPTPDSEPAPAPILIPTPTIEPISPSLEAQIEVEGTEAQTTIEPTQVPTPDSEPAPAPILIPTPTIEPISPSIQALPPFTPNSTISPTTPIIQSIKDIPKTQPIPLFSPLYPGSTGEEVVRLQTELEKLGYFKGAKAPIFGPNTKTSVGKFQEDVLGMKTGEVGYGNFGPVTSDALNNILDNKLGSTDSDSAQSNTQANGCPVVDGCNRGEIVGRANNVNKSCYIRAKEDCENKMDTALKSCPINILKEFTECTSAGCVYLTQKVRNHGVCFEGHEYTLYCEAKGLPIKINAVCVPPRQLPNWLLSD